MADIDNPNDKDLIYLGSGFLLSGILLIGLPVCIPRQHPLAAICKIGSSILAVGAFGVAGYSWRRWHKVIVPDIQLQRAVWEQEREELLLNQSQERLDQLVAVSVSKQIEPVEDFIETPNQPVTELDQPATQLTHKQLERLFYEGSDEVRNWLRENGLTPPQNSLNSPQDKGLTDSKKPGSSENLGNNQLADSAPASSQLPEWGEEKLRDGTKWNYSEAARRISYLVAGGMELERAIYFVTGATSGTVYQSCLNAYRKSVD